MLPLREVLGDLGWPAYSIMFVAAILCVCLVTGIIVIFHTDIRWAIYNTWCFFVGVTDKQMKKLVEGLDQGDV